MQPPLTITVPAVQLRNGDYVQGKGVVSDAEAWGALAVQKIGGEWTLMSVDEKVVIHLEDYGEK